MHLAKLAAVLVLLAAAPLSITGCAQSELTGKRSFMLLSHEDDIALGQEAAPQVVAELGGIYQDEAVRSYVQRVGQKVADQARQVSYAYPYEFDVVDNDMINAFALPGGPIFVTRGLLFQMENEAQLAGVLGHEVTHVAARHSAQQISKAVGAQLIFAIIQAAASRSGGGGGAGGIAGDLGKVVGAILNLKYSRENEVEADTYGVDFMTQAGYSPEALISVMQMFQRMEDEAGGGGPAFLRTHPYPEDRVENIRNLINEKYPNATSLGLGSESYQQNVLSRRGRSN